MAKDTPQTMTAPEREATAPTSWLVGATLVLIVLVGVGVRLPGWQGGGLFYDDAWLALPARMPLTTAVHMIVTAPGYTLVQAGWIRLVPTSNRWALLLPLLLGCAAPIAVFVMARICALPAWVCLVMAGVVAAEPAAIEYSTRVKPYEAELVVAAALLAGAEIVRRRRSTRSIIVFGVASTAALILSTGLLSIVVGAWLAVIVIAVLDGRNLRVVILTAGAAALCSTPLLIWIAGRIPPALTAFWVGAYRLPGAPWTPLHLARIVGVSAGGLLHGLLGTPMWQPATGLGELHRSQVAALLILAGMEVAVLVVISLPAFMSLAARDTRSPSLVVLPAIAALLVAAAEYLVGLVPLGTGRTDLVVVPAILLVLGVGLVRLGSWVAARLSPGRSASVGLALAVGAGALGTALAWYQRAWYPIQAVRTLDARITAASPTGSSIRVIVYRNSFTWAFEGLDPFTVHFSNTALAASTIGYWVTFDNPRVFVQLPGSATGPGAIPGLGAVRGAPDLWLIGITAGTLQPSTIHLTGRAAAQPITGGADTVLRRLGWTPTGTIERAPGVFAERYSRAVVRSTSPRPLTSP